MWINSRATKFGHKCIQITGKVTHGTVLINSQKLWKVLCIGLSRKVRHRAGGQHHEAGHGSPYEKGGDGGIQGKGPRGTCPFPPFSLWGRSCWAVFSQIIMSTCRACFSTLWKTHGLHFIFPRASKSDVFPVPIRIHLWQNILSHNRPIRWFLVGGSISQLAFPSLFCLKKGNMFGLIVCSYRECSHD